MQRYRSVVVVIQHFVCMVKATLDLLHVATLAARNAS